MVTPAPSVPATNKDSFVNKPDHYSQEIRFHMMLNHLSVITQIRRLISNMFLFAGPPAHGEAGARSHQILHPVPQHPQRQQGRAQGRAAGEGHVGYCAEQIEAATLPHDRLRHQLGRHVGGVEAMT